MKDQYTIHEIAELYGVGPDSLRYYEKLGLIHPRRGANGYRLYSLSDIYRLNIIRDLLGLGFDTARIREYLDGLSVENTLAMLQKERDMIEMRRRQLLEAERSIEARVRSIGMFGSVKEGEVQLMCLPERRCVRLNADIYRDEEFDFAIKKLHHMHDDTMRDMGSQTMGASLSTADMDAGVYGLFRSVFFALPEGAPNYDFALPAGRYACLYYRGSYRRCRERVQFLRDWLRAHGYAERGDVLEIYRIDNRYTVQEDEFVTELQLMAGE